MKRKNVTRKSEVRKNITRRKMGGTFSRSQEKMRVGNSECEKLKSFGEGAPRKIKKINT